MSEALRFNSPESRRHTHAFLIDFYGGDYQLGLVQGAEEASTKFDAHLVVPVGRWLNAPNPNESTQNDIYSHLRAPGTDAVAIAAGCISHFVDVGQLKEFFASFAPLPVVSVSVEVPDVPSLVVDNRQGQRTVVEHLIEAHRCRRIAYIRGPETSFEATERFDGYRQALHAHGMTVDPELVEIGSFWVDSGREGVARMLHRGTEFDALVAANDYMALGAMDYLKAQGIRVPQDVRIAGFDDVPSARMASPSLTTVRQPLQHMGNFAIQLLEDQLGGKAVARRFAFEVELVRRQSCGCGYVVARNGASSPTEESSPMRLEEFRGRRQDLSQEMFESIFVQNEQWPGRIEALLDAFEQELSGKSGRFLGVLGDLVEQARSRPDTLDQFYNIVGVFRQRMRHRTFEGRSVEWQEDLWHSAVLLIGEWIGRAHMRTVFDQERSNDTLRASVERLSTTLTHAALSEAVSNIVPTMSIASSCLGLASANSPDQLQVFSVTGEPSQVKLLGNGYRAEQLAPAGFFPTDRRSTYVLMPLTHSDTVYGQALLEAGEQCSIYSMLREQIGAALKATDMHGAVVEETSRRERAERERLERDTQIAQQIQTAILPEKFNVPGLDIAAIMRPATSVGGDYYDVIPTDTGCYLAIGDVTGHGLLSGMIMLMVQSMIAATIHGNPEKTPSQLLSTINRALYDNIHHRLHQTDHVTLTLMQYQTSGRILLSGAHEEPILWRKRTGKCQRINTPGFWLAAIADLEDISKDLELELEAGDLIFFYTDGVTEAMNAAHEQFGLARLVALVERCAAETPSRICETVLQAIRAWTNVQIDDISLMAARHDPSTVGD